MELNTLNYTFIFAFMSATYTRVIDFGHYFSQKCILRLIRESTYMRVYTVVILDYVKERISRCKFFSIST